MTTYGTVSIKLDELETNILTLQTIRDAIDGQQTNVTNVFANLEDAVAGSTAASNFDSILSTVTTNFTTIKTELDNLYTAMSNLKTAAESASSALTGFTV